MCIAFVSFFFFEKNAAKSAEAEIRTNFSNDRTACRSGEARAWNAVSKKRKCEKAGGKNT